MRAPKTASLLLWSLALVLAPRSVAGTSCDGAVLNTARACAAVMSVNPSWPVVAWSLQAGRWSVIQRAPEGYVRQTCTHELLAEVDGGAAAEPAVQPPVAVYPPPTVGTPPARVFDSSALDAAAIAQLLTQARREASEIDEQAMCALELRASWMAADARESRPAGAYTQLRFTNDRSGHAVTFDANGEPTGGYSVPLTDGTDVQTNPADSWSTVAPAAQHNWIKQADLALQRIATELPANARILMLWANERNVEVRYRRGDGALRDWKLTVAGRVIDAEPDAALPECDPGLSPTELLASYEQERQQRGGPPISASGNLIWECSRGGPPRWR